MSENHDNNKRFEQSINELTADDISKKKKKKQSFQDFIFDNLRYLLIAVCSITLIISLVNIAGAIKGYAEQNRIYGDVGDFVMDDPGVEMMFPSNDMPVTPTYDKCQELTDSELGDLTNSTVVNKEYERVRIKLMNIKSQYPNLYGWITVSGTNINYPIMQADDNDYYLNHSYTGASLGAGAIFADYSCEEPLMNNRNFVVYGHHMSNSSMFHQLDNFLRASFFNSNGKVTVYTLDGMYVYKVFSVYETNMYYPYIMTYFPSDQSFVEFAYQIQSNSIYENAGHEFDENSKILTLSTCNNRFEDGRLAVHAVMIDKYENN